MKILTKLWAAVIACSFAASITVQAGTHADSDQPSTDPDWSELIASMDKMHVAMGAIKRFGNSDVDFVRLMLPHHQAAIDMAKTQLVYGKDAQMRRLAQEIITDQQSEIQLMEPGENRLLGVIRLGDPVPAALSPLYKGQLLVHGLGYSPDSKTLAVVSVGSNSVTLIDTATNKVKGTVYVGRSPHEPFFTPNGRELWVTVRGGNSVSVIDAAHIKEP